MRKTEYDIVPDVSLMEDIGATSFTVPEAIVELIANSFDARVVRELVAVDVKVSPKEILVIDNAQGMSEDILASAIRLSVKMNEIIGTTAGRKGMFGLGMKTACASMGRYWSVNTRPIDSDQEHFVEFDLAKWSGKNRSKESEWKATIRTTDHDISGPLRKMGHGTAVTVRKLRESNPLAGAVLSKLGAAYKPHIEQGDIIKVNGERAQPPSYNLITSSQVDIDEPCGDHRITGWVGLDKQTHNDDYFGINLYRKGQLLAPWDKSWFPVHLMTSRIMGEISLDFVPPNFHKKGFETQSPEWKVAKRMMTDLLKPVVTASRTASRGKNKPMKFARAAQAIQEALGSGGGSVVVPDPNDGDDGTGAGEGGRSSPSTSVSVGADCIELPDGTIRMSSILKDFNDASIPWSYMWDGNEGMVQAVINSESKLILSTKDEGVVTLIGLADCLLQFLVEEKSMDPRKAWQIRNRWLYERTRD